MFQWECRELPALCLWLSAFFFPAQKISWMLCQREFPHCLHLKPNICVNYWILCACIMQFHLCICVLSMLFYVCVFLSVFLKKMSAFIYICLYDKWSYSWTRNLVLAYPCTYCSVKLNSVIGNGILYRGGQHLNNSGWNIFPLKIISCLPVGTQEWYFNKHR